MIVRKAEILVFMGLAGKITPADEALLDLVHPLAESALENWLQQELQFKKHVEYFPLGQSRYDTDYTLDDVEFRTNTVILRSTNRVGTDFLALKHTPVILTGMEVREDVYGYAGQSPNAFGEQTKLTLGDDYYLDVDEEIEVDGQPVHLSRSGILRRVGGWPVEPRSVRVSYYGGWTAKQMFGPRAGVIKWAAMETVANAFRAAKANNGVSAGRGPMLSENIGKYSYSYSSMFAANLMVDVPPHVKQKLFPFRSLGRLFG